MKFPRIRKALRWISDMCRDLFFSTGNEHLDLSRVIAGLFAGIATFAVYWNAIHLGKEIDLTGLLTGLAALATALGLGIAVKEWARKKAGEAAAIAQNIAVAVKAGDPVAGTNTPPTGDGATPVTVVNKPSDPVPTEEAP